MRKPVADRKDTRYDPYLNRGLPRITMVTPTFNRVEFLEDFYDISSDSLHDAILSSGSAFVAR